MKKYKFSSDKYKELKQNNIKKYTPNLPSTDEANMTAHEKMQRDKYSHVLDLVDTKPTIVENDTTKKLSLIIPYRNRQNHLTTFLQELPKVFEQQNIDYEITIVEQENGKLFNKGTLNNIGFLETINFDYFCFHDVDMIPIQSDYSLPKNIDENFGVAIHSAKFVEQFGFKELTNYFGGVVLLNRLAFKMINGYSIGYNGWGLEDDDFYRRCTYNSKVIVIYRDGIYKSLDHPHNYREDLYAKNYELYNKKIDSNLDGLNQTRYKIISKNQLSDKVKIIKVSI